VAHFAQLDVNNVVLRVIVVNNDDCKDADGNESEEVGIAFCKSLFGEGTVWKQTSYNKNFRKNYAGVGHTYDPARDAFIAPSIYQCWVFDEESCQWKPPEPHVYDGKRYYWDEVNLTLAVEDIV
jgi:hypothetical protein